MSATLQGQSGKRYTLDKPAMELAVAEVRFRSETAAINQDAGLAFREMVRSSGLAMDGFEPVVAQEVSIEMTPTGGRATTNSASQGWACPDTTTGLVATLISVSGLRQAFGRCLVRRLSLHS